MKACYRLEGGEVREYFSGMPPIEREFDAEKEDGQVKLLTIIIREGRKWIVTKLKLPASPGDSAILTCRQLVNIA